MLHDFFLDWYLMQRVVERSRLKSPILAVKAERLNDACALREELLEKDATIT